MEGLLVLFCTALLSLTHPNISSFQQILFSRLAAPTLPFEDESDDDDDEEPLVRHRPIRVASGSLAQPDADRSRSRSPEGDTQADNGNRFPSEVSTKIYLFLSYTETRLVHKHYFIRLES